MTTTSAAPTFYLSSYSSSTGAFADLVWDQAVVLNTCTQVTADTTVWVMIELDDAEFEVKVACTDDTCGDCDETMYAALDGYINEDLGGSSDNYYLLTSKSVTDASDDSDDVSSSGSILSFASVALCALFSYVLLL